MTNLYFQEKLFFSILLYRALPIKMYNWEKFWDIWDSVVFSDGRVYGAIRLGMLLECLVRLGSYEANDVWVSEAKGNTEENCSRIVEIGYEAFRFSVEGQ